MKLTGIILFPSDKPIRLDLNSYVEHKGEISVSSTIENGVLHLVVQGSKKKSSFYGIPFELSYENQSQAPGQG
jgi:hypothetical protein